MGASAPSLRLLSCDFQPPCRPAPHSLKPGLQTGAKSVGSESRLQPARRSINRCVALSPAPAAGGRDSITGIP
jgi:hypothetical protein